MNITLSAEAGWRGVTRCEVRPRAMAGAAMLVPHHLQTIEWDSDTAQFACGRAAVDWRASRESHPDSISDLSIRSGGSI
ncbi:hypothetical protein GS421_15345 [Rhodococcus hoagii]|nr:hypothetical protein [Prescottella equi]